MFKEFTFEKEKYIININDISYINMYETEDEFCLDIRLANLSNIGTICFSSKNDDEEISRVYWLIRNWLIENK